MIQVCVICNREFNAQASWVRKGMAKTCSLACNSVRRLLKSKIVGYWMGYPVTLQGGYPIIYPTGKRTSQVYLHRYIAEIALGKPLPKTCHVHHIDDNPMNWSNDNLVILQGPGEHGRIHRKMERRLRGEVPSKVSFCTKCKQLKSWDSFYPRKDGSHGVYSRCAICCRTSAKERNKTEAVT
jgi:hypothetical protein